VDALFEAEPWKIATFTQDRVFVRGVVLYLGEQRLPFADNLWAVPMRIIWSPGIVAPDPCRRAVWGERE
jgi:hypothetical protein